MLPLPFDYNSLCNLSASIRIPNECLGIDTIRVFYGNYGKLVLRQVSTSELVECQRNSIYSLKCLGIQVL